jgi:N-acetylneuraminic acid mutarotase
MAVASAGTKILFAGAASSQNSIGYSTVDIYDLATQTWSTAKLSEARSHIAAVAADNKVFFAGGGWDDDFLFTLATVDMYDVTTNTWSVALLSELRAYIGAAAVGNKVLFAGGKKHFENVHSSDFKTSDRVDIFDLSSNTWSTATLSEGRAYIAAVTAENKVYFAGGRPYYNPSSTIDIYDNGTNTWSTSSLLEPKGMSSGIAAGANIYWAGGMSSHGPSDESLCTVEIRNIHSQGSQLNHLSKPASSVIVDGQNAVVKEDKILFFRHHFRDDGSRFDIYDTVSKNWSIGVLPQSISGASIISVNNTVYIAGGWAAGVFSNRVWKLEF